MNNSLYGRVYDCIEVRLVKLACDLKLQYPYQNIMIEDLRDDFHNRIANLQICYAREYKGRDTRMLVQAYRGVVSKYG